MSTSGISESKHIYHFKAYYDPHTFTLLLSGKAVPFNELSQLLQINWWIFTLAGMDEDWTIFKWLKLSWNVRILGDLQLGWGNVYGLLNLLLFSCSVVSDSLRPHGLQHARPLCPSPTPGAYSNSCPLSQWCHPIISSSVVPFSSSLQSFPATGSFQMSQLFASGSQSIGSFSFSISPSNE